MNPGGLIFFNIYVFKAEFTETLGYSSRLRVYLNSDAIPTVFSFSTETKKRISSEERLQKKRAKQRKQRYIKIFFLLRIIYHHSDF